MRTLVKCLALSLTFACSPISPAWAQAAIQTFSVKQVTYSGKDGFFRCETKLSAGDNATLTVKVPTTDAKDVQGSIHANLPAKISSTVSGTDTIISVVITSKSAASAGVTFKKKIADSFKINYGIELSCNELDGYIQVSDQSGSNANWSDAKLQIVLPTGDICLTVTMDSSTSSISPLKAFSNYPIALEKASHFRTQAHLTYEVQNLKNLGSETLLPGDVRVMQDGVLKYGSVLNKVLSAQQSAEMRGMAVDTTKISVKSSVQEDRWFETVSIVNGVLTYSPWKVTKTTIQNQTGSNIKIYIESYLTEHDLASDEQSEIITPIEKMKLVDNKPFTANLFDLCEKTLELHIQKLEEFGQFVNKVPEDRIDDIQKQQDEILKAKTTLAPLTAAKKEIDNLLKTDSKECDPDPRIRLFASLTQIENAIQIARCAQLEATAKLVSLLFSAN